MQRLTVCGGALPAALWLAVSMAGPDAADAQARIACGGEPYVVQPGDSLSAIAQSAYSSFNYQAIFEANRDRLENPAILRVGQPLLIPCLDGRAAADEDEEQPAEELARAPSDVVTDAEPRLPVVRQLTLRGQAAESVAELTEPAPEREAEAPVLLAALPAARDVVPDGVIRMVTGSDATRFAHRDMPEGGMITDLVNRALMRADPRRRSTLDWDNDFQGHLSALRDGGRYDLAFPWFRPDCERADALAEELRALCSDFEFSAPVYSVSIGYYTGADSRYRRALGHRQLADVRLCRPQGSFVFDLEAAGLGTQATLVQPGDAAACFDLLEAGEVDVVTLDRVLGDTEVKSRGADNTVVEIPALATRETLHVVGARNDPQARAYLDLIDSGLRLLRQEGVWFELTSRHMAEQLRRQ